MGQIFQQRTGIGSPSARKLTDLGKVLLPAVKRSYFSLTPPCVSITFSSDLADQDAEKATTQTNSLGNPRLRVGTHGCYPEILSHGPDNGNLQYSRNRSGTH